MDRDVRIIDGWLEAPDSEWEVDTPFQSGDLNPKYVVFHRVKLSLERAVDRWMKNTDVKESMHLGVGRAGEWTQLAAFTKKVWHCGASYYQGHHGLNNWAIGVAVCSEDGGYTTSQYDFLYEIMPVIVQEYNIRDIICHDQVSNDAVPLLGFDLAMFKPLVRYGNADSVGRFVVSIPSINNIKLNVRGGPSERFEVIDQLAPGNGVKVLRYDALAEWAYIFYETEDHHKRQGWCYESFLKRA